MSELKAYSVVASSEVLTESPEEREAREIRMLHDENLFGK